MSKMVISLMVCKNDYIKKQCIQRMYLFIHGYKYVYMFTVLIFF